ncbi:MAG: transketolase [Rhodothermales bacterium]
MAESAVALSETELHRLQDLAANTLRGLAIDGVEKANSGHAGLPMGMADAAIVIWTEFLRHNPAEPTWADRDRFVLSAGHGSMLLYSLLHLAGYEEMTMDQLKSFRQWGSKTAGHPESFLAKGIETTTGPLGQGICNAVGMAIAEKHLAAVFNTEETPIVDHWTYVIASDGDLMEGVSNEACSLAGHLGLGKLVVLYDDNEITIDGPTSLSFSEDPVARYEALGWHTIGPIDGHDRAAIRDAIHTAKGVLDRPTLIACRTTIGFGSPNLAGTHDVHSDPLGEEEIKLTKENLGLPVDKTFYVADEVRELMGKATCDLAEAHSDWKTRWDAWRSANPDLAAQWDAMHSPTPGGDWESALPTFDADEKGMATRAASGKVIDAIFPVVPSLMGGSADLTPSNKTQAKGAQDFSQATPEGRYIRFGVREHGMGSILNGLTVHGGLRGFGGTFLVFSDYMKAAVRLSALMEIPVTWIFTHDSIGLGEDGPTHQPVEQIAGLRAIPNMYTLRPADANETAEAWRIALSRSDGPTLLALSRQGLPTLDRSVYASAEGTRRGAYVLADTDGEPDVLLLATGSEVPLVLEAKEQLAGDGIAARVVSMPCWELFREQDKSYRDEVLPPSVTARVGVEAGSSMGWHEWVGLGGALITVDRFGSSAPGDVVMRHYGFTADAVADAARKLVNG